VTKEKKEITEEEKKLHKRFAAGLFNRTWDLMDKKDRTSNEDYEMIHSAHASRYHWEQIGTPVHFERGEWQISRVYSVLERAEPALYHAKKCLEICKANDVGDFDLAFAHEAMARAYKVAGNDAKRDEHLAKAEELGKKLEKKEDLDWLNQNLDEIKK